MKCRQLAAWAAISVAALPCGVMAEDTKTVVVADYSRAVEVTPVIAPAGPAPAQTLAPAPIPAPIPEPTPETTEEPYTQEELEILAIIIYQEAGGDYCADTTRQMIGEVFLNRVADSRFPDDFKSVATAKAQYGRLHWTGLIWPERASNPGETHAVQRAYECAEALLSGTAERLLPFDAVWQAEFEQGSETIIQQDGFYFCR